MSKIKEAKYTFYSIFNKLVNESLNNSKEWINVGTQINYVSDYVEEKDENGRIHGKYVETKKPLKIMVNDAAPKVDLHDRNTRQFYSFSEKNVKFINEEGDNMDYGTADKKEYDIFPEYKNTYWDWFFNGLNETKEQEHEWFLSQLDTVGDKVILKHRSPYKITDDVVGGKNKKAPNSWSNNTDIGNYFWGGKIGEDPSGEGSDYTYYCEVPIDDIYDYRYNPKNYKSLKQAAEEEPYVGVPFGGSIAVISLGATKISRKEDEFGNNF